MNTEYLLLKHTLISQEQVKEFSYNIMEEEICKYVGEHQEEFNKWKETEILKQIIKNAMKVKIPINIIERTKILKELKGEN